MDLQEISLTKEDDRQIQNNYILLSNELINPTQISVGLCWRRWLPARVITALPYESICMHYVAICYADVYNKLKR